MNDLRTKIEKYLAEAEECDLIARLACDPLKRKTFTALAEHHRQMAAEVEATMIRMRSRANAQT